MRYLALLVVTACGTAPSPETDPVHITAAHATRYTYATAYGYEVTASVNRDARVTVSLVTPDGGLLTAHPATTSDGGVTVWLRHEVRADKVMIAAETDDSEDTAAVDVFDGK